MNHPSHAATAQQPAFSERDFRNALGQFATGVAVVTTTDAKGTPFGMTISSFNSVSLQPALVLWSLSTHAGCYSAFANCHHFVIHVLASHQKALALQFASRGVDRFAEVSWQPNAHGIPVLTNAIATFECRTRSQYPEGDHLIMVGEVLACHHLQQASPLIFHNGKMC